MASSGDGGSSILRRRLSSQASSATVRGSIPASAAASVATRATPARCRVWGGTTGPVSRRFFALVILSLSSLAIPATAHAYTQHEKSHEK